MALKISGKNVDIGQALRSRIDQTIADAVQKFFDGGYSGHVTMTRNGRAFGTDCSVHLDSGMVIEASGNDKDANASFDQALERLQKRLRRYKRRLKMTNLPRITPRQSWRRPRPRSKPFPSAVPSWNSI